MSGAGLEKNKKPYQATHINVTVKNLHVESLSLSLSLSLELDKKPFQAEHIDLKVKSLQVESLSLSLSLEKDKKPEHINLTVTYQDVNKEFFEIKRNTPLKKLKNVYCARQNEDLDWIRFLFDGKWLSGEQTPNEVTALPTMPLAPEESDNKERHTNALVKELRYMDQGISIFQLCTLNLLMSSSKAAFGGNGGPFGRVSTTTSSDICALQLLLWFWDP